MTYADHLSAFAGALLLAAISLAAAIGPGAVSLPVA